MRNLAIVTVFALLTVTQCVQEPAHSVHEKLPVKKKDVRYNIIFRQGVAPQQFHQYVDEIASKHKDSSLKGFKAEIVRKLVNMKMITVRNPSQQALEYFRAHQKIKFVEKIEENANSEL